MITLRELYRIGHGPSSSHTMGPRHAAEIYLQRHPEAAAFHVTLYGSLAATGRGHRTDWAIYSVLGEERTTFTWNTHIFLPFHPNGMTFSAVDASGKEYDAWTVYSIGGGALAEEGQQTVQYPHIYEMNHATEILRWTQQTGKSFWEYVNDCEGPEIWSYLAEVWRVMKEAVERGLEHEEALPGGLNIRRKAASYYTKAEGYQPSMRSRGLIFAYALAVIEENASSGLIVTAPTCGSCGVLPGVLYHIWKSRQVPEVRILRALATAGLFGNIVKQNASISGAEVGCQGEVGVACAMAAAAASQLFGASPAQIEYAAEMGLEHHLGLTVTP